MPSKFNCIIMGAAGRDFHDFQTFFRRHPEFRVKAFTATQIPYIEQRVFPQSLAGSDYSDDIPIHAESEIVELIDKLSADFVFLSYSDLAHIDVMHKASIVQAAGASFVLLGPRQTQLVSKKPVISVTATRTGAGKSPLTQMLAKHLTDRDYRVAVIRHPMPYGDLAEQVVERFTSVADLDRYSCTIEEREEYEPYLELGLTVFAGVDYERILRAAEQEADVILWDGGNNDTSFVRPDLSIVVLDVLRAGQELQYYPGETNLRGADVLVINKVAQADEGVVEEVRRRIQSVHPRASVATADLEITADDPHAVANKRVLVVEDGPTLTHGGMSYGAGFIAAQRFGARELIDPRGAAVGSIAEAYKAFPHLGRVLPALGYSEQQCEELAQTIVAANPEVVVDASPARLDRLLQLSLPLVRVRYRFQQRSGESLTDRVVRTIEEAA